MDKARKKMIKRIIGAVCAVTIVILLAAMPLIARQDAATDGPQASILSGTVQSGSLDIALMGGGTLAEEEAETLTVPTAVKLTKFLVSNGDSVLEGDAIASVDRVSVMQAITEIQQTLEHLSEEIEAESKKDGDTKVSALAGGTVKILYAQEGQSVQEVMLAHGALAVLSLDGLMAVDLEVSSNLSAGTAVTVTLADGTEADGRVETNLDGVMTVTFEDDDYALGETVEVSTLDGEAIGSGELYIYSPWNATAYAGTVSKIRTAEGKTVRAGDTLMTLEDVGYTAAYRQLIAQRQEYEEMMLDLFRMYQTELLTAPCDGVVSGIDKDSAQLLSTQEGSWFLDLLTNAPNGDDEAAYTNFIGQVTSVEEGMWNLMINPTALNVTDYKDLSGIPTDPNAMTQAASYSAQVPIYTLVGGAWSILSSSAVNPSDVLLFAFTDGYTPVWAVRIIAGAVPENPTEPTDPSIPTDPTQPSEPTNPSGPNTPADPGATGTPGTTDTPGGTTVPGGSTTIPGGSMPSIGGNFSGMGGMGILGGYPQTQEEEFQLYALDTVQIAAVTPQDTVTLDITIDELDINTLKPGMTAQVQIDALGGEKFTATITGIGNTGSNNGGSSKFTVELTMERAADMLAGMNATATIIIDSTGDGLTIPASALVEEGTKTLVYTGYDAESDTLTDPVTVQVGVSDGETVQILEGLSLGQTYYYAYYDTLEISYTPDFGNSFMFGG